MRQLGGNATQADQVLAAFLGAVEGCEAFQLFAFPVSVVFAGGAELSAGFSLPCVSLG